MRLVTARCTVDHYVGRLSCPRAYFLRRSTAALLAVGTPEPVAEKTTWTL
jgi:hypothetical protein